MEIWNLKNVSVVRRCRRRNRSSCQLRADAFHHLETYTDHHRLLSAAYGPGLPAVSGPMGSLEVSYRSVRPMMSVTNTSRYRFSATIAGHPRQQ